MKDEIPFLRDHAEISTRVVETSGQLEDGGDVISLEITAVIKTKLKIDYLYKLSDITHIIIVLWLHKNQKVSTQIKI